MRSYGSPSSTTTSDVSGAPLSQRRRLNNTSDDTPIKPEWNNLYTLPGDFHNYGSISRSSPWDELDESQKDPAEGMGELSLDEHQEVSVALTMYDHPDNRPIDQVSWKG